MAGVLGTMLGGDAANVMAKGKKSKGKKGKAKGKSKRCPAGCPECQECGKSGSCKAVTDGAGCGNNPCKECQGGTCGNKAGNASCAGTGRCLNGTCNPRPQCLIYNIFQSCTVGGTPCCGGGCDPVLETCSVRGAAGTDCQSDNDCVSGRCVGYLCQ